MERTLKRTIIIISMALITAIPVFAIGAVNSPASAAISATAGYPGKFVNVKKCYSRLNNYRKAKNRVALKRNAALEKVAKVRAKEIVRKFSHTRPNGRSGLSMIKGNVYKGENIAMGQKTCREVSIAWYRSPGHRSNMMFKKYRKVGIAGFKYNGIIYWVQVFSS